MALNKDVISELLKNNSESANEFLKHLGSFLQIVSTCHKFTENPHFLPYLKKAQDQGMMPPAATEISSYQKQLGPIGQAYSIKSFNERSRRPRPGN